MGHDPDREHPFFFQKFPDNIVPSGLKDNAKFPYPPLSKNVHHEIELVAALGKGAFVLTARNREHFAEAILKKLILEIAGDEGNRDVAKRP